MITYKELKELATTALNRKYGRRQDGLRKAPTPSLDEAIRLIGTLENDLDERDRIVNPDEIQRATLSRIRDLLAR